MVAVLSAVVLVITVGWLGGIAKALQKWRDRR